MRLKHEIKTDSTRFLHRLIDLDQPALADLQRWVGFRTPAIWKVSGDDSMGHFVAVTAYYRGSEEFPAGDKYFYFVKGVPAVEDNVEGVMSPKYRMMLGVYAMLDNYVEHLIETEEPAEAAKLKAIDRLEMFHEAMGEHLKRLRQQLVEVTS